VKNRWGHLVATATAAGTLGLLVVGSGLATTSQKAAAYQISAPMTAKQVTPPRPAGNVGKAQGLLKGSATLDKRSTVAWKLTYSGMTGPVVSALVRFKNAKSITTSISLCAKKCKSGEKSFTFFPSRAQAERFVKQVLEGKADVVLTTKRNPKGEVRGVLKAHAT
jgi:CHRD domain